MIVRNNNRPCLPKMHEVSAKVRPMQGFLNAEGQWIVVPSDYMLQMLLVDKVYIGDIVVAAGIC